MYPNRAARELGVLLRISQELDVVGDVTAIVANPSELLAWGNYLSDPKIVAWQAADDARRYVQVSATHEHEPIRGKVAAVLHCESHTGFWEELTSARDLGAGDQVAFTLADLSRAWNAMPITPPS